MQSHSYSSGDSPENGKPKEERRKAIIRRAEQPEVYTGILPIGFRYQALEEGAHHSLLRGEADEERVVLCESVRYLASQKHYLRPFPRLH